MKFFNVSSVFLAVAVLSACGGGGDAAGDVSALSLTSDEWTVEFAAGSSCEISSVEPPRLTVAIVGGQEPFRVVNARPEKMSVNKTVVSGKDPSFQITLLGGCMESMPITVLDYHSQSIAIEVTVEEAAATTTVAP